MIRGPSSAIDEEGSRSFSFVANVRHLKLFFRLVDNFVMKVLMRGKNGLYLQNVVQTSVLLKGTVAHVKITAL
jgi:hypothetical protein